MQEAVLYIVVLVLCFSVSVDKLMLLRQTPGKDKERTAAPTKTCRSIRRSRRG